jgi:hypothetical protein
VREYVCVYKYVRVLVSKRGGGHMRCTTRMEEKSAVASGTALIFHY